MFCVFFGDVVQFIVGMQVLLVEVEVFWELFGLNCLLFVQYVDWIGGIFCGDFGMLLLFGVLVGEELFFKVQVIVFFGIMLFFIVVFIVVLFGIFVVLFCNCCGGMVLSVGVQMFVVVFVVWVGMMFVVVFFVWFGWLLLQGFLCIGWVILGWVIELFLLLVFMIGIVEGVMLMWFVCSVMLQVVGQDFVCMVVVKGFICIRVLIQYGIFVVGFLIVIVFGLQVVGIIVGLVVIEQFFIFFGIGCMFVVDVGICDFVKVQSEFFVLIGFVFVVGFLVDFVYWVIDFWQREVV